MPLITQAQSRKERRKQERTSKRRPQQQLDPTNASDNDKEGDHIHNADEEGRLPARDSKNNKRKKIDDGDASSRSGNKGEKKSKKTSGGRYGHMDPTLAAAVERDDEEIAELEAKLGLGGKKSKEREKLHREYAKEECYGDDFGEFLDDLDDMVMRVVGRKPARTSDDDEEDDEKEDEREEESDEEDDEAIVYSEDEVEEKPKGKKVVQPKPKRIEERGDLYAHMDPALAEALRRDDEEIAELEAKMGLGNRKGKEKLHKEYAKLEGYGDDFGEFLDDLDDMIVRVKTSGSTGPSKMAAKLMKGHDSEGSEEDSDDEELVPMKEPYADCEDDLDSEEEAEDEEEVDSDAELEVTEHGTRAKTESRDEDGEADSSEDSSKDENVGESNSDEESESGDDDSEVAKPEPDHDIKDTYRPIAGQDIYGNAVDDDGMNEGAPKKYVPPHMREKMEEDSDQDRQEKLRTIQRLLNNALNRLSEDSLISVAQGISKIYPSHPTQMVHEALWTNTKNACVNIPILMTGMIPVYVACLVGVHVQTGDTVQLGEYLLEMVTLDLWTELTDARKKDCKSKQMDAVVDAKAKQACNLILVLCYLYNYNIVHCSFLYDVIRNLIENFSELDVECLLLVLSHCGRSLRSDDPLALKEIVLMVQKKQSEQNGSTQTVSSSRADYMVSAIMDLKNNKRRQQDTVYMEKTAKLRKFLGRIKSTAATSSSGKTTFESSLRISFQDVLNAETKGRWWKVGASWVGNQYSFTDNADGVGNEVDDDNSESKKSTVGHKDVEQDEALLRLASKYRMNTDQKRAIFCIIMGCADCEDAFEKLCRGGMLQNRSERDTVRVLMECCGNEKSYNKFYSHLASQVCDFQPQCRFSFQLAFWDAFKQFDTMSLRKAANLAKLLFHLVAVHQVLKLTSVIKVIDMSSTEEMEENALIFLTISLTSILEYADDPLLIQNILASHHAPSKKSVGDEIGIQEDQEGAQASLLVFFLETLKSSPKNKKGSKFRKNYKAAIKALDTDSIENMF